MADDLRRCLEDENVNVQKTVEVKMSDDVKSGGCVADTHLFEEGEDVGVHRGVPT